MKTSISNRINDLILLLLLAMACVLPGIAIAGGLWHARDDANAAPDILPVDQAFQLQPVERSAHGFRTGWLVSKGYYLYRERISIEAAKPANVKLAAPTLPAGEKHHDEHFGDVHIYRAGNYTVEVAGKKTMQGLKRVKISYQGCAESGVCYPPQTRIMDVLSLSQP